MGRSMPLLALLTVFSGLAMAESWQGRLLDASCYEQHKSAATCDATSSTTTFSLFVSNQAYKLDDAGNAKVVEALKSRADRSSDPSKPLAGMIMAKITGSKEGEGILKVESVELQ